MYKDNYWLLETERNEKGREVFVTQHTFKGTEYFCKHKSGKAKWMTKKEILKIQDKVINIGISGTSIYPVSMNVINKFQEDLAHFKSIVEQNTKFKVVYNKNAIYEPGDNITLSLDTSPVVPNSTRRKVPFTVELYAEEVAEKKYAKILRLLQNEANITPKACKDTWERECNTSFGSGSLPTFEKMANYINAEVKALKSVIVAQSKAK